MTRSHLGVRVAGLLASVLLALVTGAVDAAVVAAVVVAALDPAAGLPGLASLVLPLTASAAAFASVAVVLLVSLGRTVVRRVDPARDLYALLAHLERASDAAASLRPTRFVGGWLSPDDRRASEEAALKERYVAGDLSREAFERELERLYG